MIKIVGVRVGVNVLAGVAVAVCVAVRVGVFVGVPGVAVGTDPAARKVNASTSLAVSPQVLPSKYKADEYEQAVTAPSEVGTQTKTSSSAPAIPLTVKLSTVDR